MRLYQVKVSGKVRRWTGSMAECREAKKELAGGDVKASSVTYEETEVPTSKPELMAFLNENCVDKS